MLKTTLLKEHRKFSLDRVTYDYDWPSLPSYGIKYNCITTQGEKAGTKLQMDGDVGIKLHKKAVQAKSTPFLTLNLSFMQWAEIQYNWVL
jgi:hypothetical protein